MPHLEVLRILSTCDIVVGKILLGIGWFGKFELEGMAFGQTNYCPLTTSNNHPSEPYSQQKPQI